MGSVITVAIYNSTFIAAAFFALFCAIILFRDNGKRKNDFDIILGLSSLSVGVFVYFMWGSLWRQANAARDLSAWMIDYPINWASAIMISFGMIAILKGLTDDYWVMVTFVWFVTLLFNLAG